MKKRNKKTEKVVEKRSFEDIQFDQAMELLDNAITNVIWNSDNTLHSAILIEYLYKSANNLEESIAAEMGEDWLEELLED